VTAPALEIDTVAASYGDAMALRGVSVSVPPGGTLAVLGANGAGKSTLARVISGLHRPLSGRVRIDGTDVTAWSAHRRARRCDVVHVLEGHGVFPRLTVRENLNIAFAGATGESKRGAQIDKALSQFPILAKRRKQAAGTLSGGERQILALARAVVAPPRLLIADEVSLGLAPRIVDQVFGLLRAAREAGTAMVVVEQYIDRALGLADEAIVLRRGEISWSGPAQGARARVHAEYLGSGAVGDGQPVSAPPAPSRQSSPDGTRESPG
jgi:branched-chain amino acid transport system ATP-binding protein